MRLITLVLCLLLCGCAASPSCGTFDTDKLRKDLAQETGRTDREWYETLIKQLAWQLDCERKNCSDF